MQSLLLICQQMSNENTKHPVFFLKKKTAHGSLPLETREGEKQSI